MNPNNQIAPILAAFVGLCGVVSGVVYQFYVERRAGSVRPIEAPRPLRPLDEQARWLAFYVFLGVWLISIAFVVGGYFANKVEDFKPFVDKVWTAYPTLLTASGTVIGALMGGSALLYNGRMQMESTQNTERLKLRLTVLDARIDTLGKLASKLFAFLNSINAHRVKLKSVVNLPELVEKEDLAKLLTSVIETNYLIYYEARNPIVELSENTGPLSLDPGSPPLFPAEATLTEVVIMYLDAVSRYCRMADRREVSTASLIDESEFMVGLVRALKRNEENYRKALTEGGEPVAFESVDPKITRKSIAKRMELWERIVLDDDPLAVLPPPSDTMPTPVTTATIGATV